eukprot:860256-Pelagomonas_calceolata.AAC.11
MHMPACRNELLQAVAVLQLNKCLCAMTHMTFTHDCFCATTVCELWQDLGKGCILSRSSAEVPAGPQHLFLLSVLVALGITENFQPYTGRQSGHVLEDCAKAPEGAI